MTCQSGICRCGSFQFHNISTLACTSQNSHNQPCIVDFNCRVDKGLECSNSTCQCINVTPTWISNTGWVKCIKLKNYTETCTSSIECDGSVGLVCNSGSNNNLCNCPSTSSVGMCDCVRRSSNETYWNGTKCIPAAAFGQSCITNTNYTCQTTTEKTMCNSSGICSCGTNGGIKTSTGQCVSCAIDWYYYNEKCYRISATPGAMDTSASSGTITAACANAQSGVSVCRLNNNGVKAFLRSLSTAGVLYWIDLHKETCSGGWWSSSDVYTSCDSCSSCNGEWSEDETTSAWCSSSNSNTCVYYNYDTNCYKDDSCTSSRLFYCQYTAI